MNVGELRKALEDYTDNTPVMIHQTFENTRVVANSATRAFEQVGDPKAIKVIVISAESEAAKV